MDGSGQEEIGKPAGRLRFFMLALLFAATTVNYADRATLSIAGTQMQAQLGLSVIAMGYLFSAFGWSYVVAQLPGGWLLDRFGSRRVYLLSIFLWAVLGLAQGVVGVLRPAGLVATLF
ncbi:MAG TPA: MFS transporter [Steroidobacteraceae bacterium]